VPKEEAVVQKCIEIYKRKDEHLKELGARMEAGSAQMEELVELGRHVINALCIAPSQVRGEDSTVAPLEDSTVAPESEDSTVAPQEDSTVALATLTEDSTVAPTIKIVPRKKKVVKKAAAAETNNK
jgi:hypothetical protein